MTNDVPIEHLGPWETHEAYHGSLGLVLSRFANRKPDFGLIVGHNRDLAVWLRGSNRR